MPESVLGTTHACHLGSSKGGLWPVRAKGFRTACGHLQDFFAHIHDPEPVAELGEAVQFSIALLQGHLLLAGQLPAEVLHQLALQRHRAQEHSSEMGSRGEKPAIHAHANASQSCAVKSVSTKIRPSLPPDMVCENLGL